MALEQLESALTVVNQVEVPRPIVDNVPAAPLLVDAPTQEQAQAIDHVFAHQHEEQRYAVIDLVTLAAAGMLVHDIVKDTLAEPEEEEEEEPALKPKGPKTE